MKKDSKKLQNCKQDKCAFMIVGQGCRACQECKTEPYIVHDDCVRCWNCEHDAGILRWDDQDKIEQAKQLQLARIR